MSKWTKFRIIFECQNSEAQIREIFGEPIPEVTDENVDDDLLWDRASDNCHLATGSEGSLSYELFRWHEKQMVLIFGNLRDYTPSKGIAWWGITKPKFKYPIVDVCIIEEA